MRYIILLIAISLNAYYPVGEFVNSPDSVTYRMKAPLKFKDAIEIKRDLEQLKELSDYYERYKRECYNDSTKIWVFRNGRKWDGKEFLCVDGNMWVHLKEAYEHKEPTFDGFMTWLRNILSGGRE